MNNNSSAFLIDPRAHGALADGETDDTAALQAAIDAATAQGGGRVVLSGGVFRSGTLFLKSNLTLEVGEGAVLRALPLAECFPDIPIGRYSRMDTVPWKAFLYACDAENLTVTGAGLIDGMGRADLFTTGVGNDPKRPYGLHIVGCRNVEVSGLRLRNSAFWMQRYLDCDGVRLDGLKVYNHANLNNDGCDIDSCRDVIVSNCLIDSADDSLCFKSEGAPACENVTVTNCVLASFASPLKWGTGSIGGFRNFNVSNITIRKSNAGENLHGMRADYGMAGIDMAAVDGGALENIQVNNVVMDKIETPIFIKLGRRNSRLDESGARVGATWPDAPAPSESLVRNIRIANVIATGYGPVACSIVGYEGNPISGISLSNITLHCGRPSTVNNLKVWDENGKEVFEIEGPADGSLPVAQPSWDVKNAPEMYPMSRIYNTPLPVYGFYLAYAEDILLSDVELRPAARDPRPAIGFQNVRNIRLRAVDARANGAVEPLQARATTGITLDGQPVDLKEPGPDLH
ncbi:MAG: glycoside hydrolase family 28 protein [Opitutales bacterium]